MSLLNGYNGYVNYLLGDKLEMRHNASRCNYEEGMDVKIIREYGNSNDYAAFSCCMFATILPVVIRFMQSVDNLCIELLGDVLIGENLVGDKSLWHQFKNGSCSSNWIS